MADKSYQKGITVEIGGNTAPLNKALADVGKQSRDLQTELKQVDKLLQVDPGNTELLAQKQKLLADSVKVTGDRLDVLRQAQEKFIAEGGKVDSAAYRDLQRDVIATEQKLGGLQKESEQTSGALDKAGNSAKEAGDKATESGSDAEQGSGGWEKLGEGLSGATKAAVATTAAVGGALVAGVGYAVDFANEVQKASNSFIAATGISTDAVQDFDEAMLRIYNNNFGESMEDISTSMTTVAQSARDIDPKNIEMLTQNALMFRDTFGFEVGEQMRAVNMLIDQFGISGEEAFNLIAQGAQNGLDKNGDLLDSINEYSVHFKSLGLDAESMFNSFVNGTAGGTFSVDKLGDAIKEFGIRSKDGSEGSIKAFQAIGLNAEETTAAFAAGGEQASKAFEQVTASLFSLKDPLSQNTAGVALFGTMWEDLGVKGMEYLVDMNGEISTSVDALSAINAVKYDDFDSAMEGLGRVLKTNFVLPIGEEVLPALSDFVNELSAGAVTADGDISKMADSFGTATTGLVEDFSAIIPEITAIAGEIVGGLISGLATSLPEISTAAVELINALAQGLIEALPDIAVAATDILLALVDGLIGALPLLLDGATQMIRFSKRYRRSAPHPNSASGGSNNYPYQRVSQ